MLIESGWKPGVWIDGDHSSEPVNGDVFGTFAHLVHDDLLAARAAGRIAAQVEFTISATTIRPLWGDEPPVWMLHIRFAGLADPRNVAVQDAIAFEALSILARRERDQVPADMLERYAVRLFFVDEHGHPLCSRTHALGAPSGGIRPPGSW